MAWEIIHQHQADVGSFRLAGDAQPAGEFVTYSGFLIAEVDAEVEGRCVVRLRRPTATSGPTEAMAQIDTVVGEPLRVRIPLGSVVLSTDPANTEGAFSVTLAWVSRQRVIQDDVIRQRIRDALVYTRTRLQEFPNNQRFLAATWQAIGDELAAQVSQKVVGGTIEPS
jgi:hypothetical protein